MGRSIFGDRQECSGVGCPSQKEDYDIEKESECDILDALGYQEIRQYSPDGCIPDRVQSDM